MSKEIKSAIIGGFIVLAGGVLVFYGFRGVGVGFSGSDAAPPPPNIDYFTSTAYKIPNPNTPFTLKYKATAVSGYNVTCYAYSSNPQWTGKLGGPAPVVQGQKTINGIQGNYQKFTLLCATGISSVTEDIWVDVDTGSLSVWAVPGIVPKGAPTTIKWKSTQMDTCYAAGGVGDPFVINQWMTPQSKPVNGQEQVVAGNKSGVQTLFMACFCANNNPSCNDQFKGGAFLIP